MKRSSTIPILAILIGAFILRIAAIAAQPLSGDEAFTITKWGPASLSYLLNDIATIDPQPPGALLTYHFWIQIAGQSEFAVRLLSASFSLLTVAAVYRLAKSFLTTKAAAFAAILCAIAPFQIWYGQDARHYAEWMCFSLLATTALVHALPTKRFIPWLIYTVLACISLQTFYLELFLYAAASLFVLLDSIRARRINRAWLPSQLIIIATYVPWLIYSKPQSSPYQPTASFPDIPTALAELLFNNTLPAQLTSQPFSGTSITILQVLLILVALYATIALIKSQLPTPKHLVILQLIVPIVLLTALSLITHKAFFRTRYIAAASAPLIILLATIPSTLPTRAHYRLVAMTLALILTPLSFAAYAEYRNNPEFAKAPPWREIASILTQNALPADLVIQNYPDPAFTYYYQGPAKAITLPSTENPPAAATIAQLEPLPSHFEHLWFIRVDTPYWDRQEVVANWLQDNTLYLSDTWVGSMRLYQYAASETTSQYIRHPLNINLGLAVLSGYRLSVNPPVPAQPQELTLELFWQPRQHTTADLHVFVHLITTNSNGSVQLWGQDDHPPQSGRISTTSWPTAGTIFRDIYHIPLPTNHTGDSYQLVTGFYDPTTTDRYPLPSSLPQPEPNSILITTITFPTPK